MVYGEPTAILSAGVIDMWRTSLAIIDLVDTPVSVFEHPGDEVVRRARPDDVEQVGVFFLKLVCRRIS